MKKYLLVGNPTAQSGRNAERIGVAQAEFERREAEVEFQPTLPDGRTVQMVRQRVQQDRFDAVIYMGGDGTFREVAEGILLAKVSVPMGMLPTGTANDQGKSFGLEAGDGSLLRNIDVILSGHQTMLDAGLISEGDRHFAPHSYFFDSAGWGISARILAARNADRRAVEGTWLSEVYRDHLVYAGATARVFLESLVTASDFTVEVDFGGGVLNLTGLTDLVIKNTRIYAGSWVMDRNSRHNDGWFEMVPFRGKADWLSKALVDLDGNPITEEALNAVGIEHSKPMKVRSVTLRFPDQAQSAQIDGEEFTALRSIRVENVRCALKLIVPAEHSDA